MENRNLDTLAALWNETTRPDGYRQDMARMRAARRAAKVHAVVVPATGAALAVAGAALAVASVAALGGLAPLALVPWVALASVVWGRLAHD